MEQNRNTNHNRNQSTRDAGILGAIAGYGAKLEDEAARQAQRDIDFERAIRRGPGPDPEYEARRAGHQERLEAALDAPIDLPGASAEPTETLEQRTARGLAAHMARLQAQHGPRPQ